MADTWLHLVALNIQPVEVGVNLTGRPHCPGVHYALEVTFQQVEIKLAAVLEALVNVIRITREPMESLDSAVMATPFEGKVVGAEEATMVVEEELDLEGQGARAIATVWSAHRSAMVLALPMAATVLHSPTLMDLVVS